MLSSGAVRRKNGYASLFDKAGLVAEKEFCGTCCTAARVAMGIVMMSKGQPAIQQQVALRPVLTSCPKPAVFPPRKVMAHRHVHNAWAKPGNERCIPTFPILQVQVSTAITASISPATCARSPRGNSEVPLSRAEVQKQPLHEESKTLLATVTTCLLRRGGQRYVVLHNDTMADTVVLSAYFHPMGAWPRHRHEGEEHFHHLLRLAQILPGLVENGFL